jgi:hypothetical protein
MVISQRRSFVSNGSASARRTSRVQKGRFLPTLEALEQRCLLSVDPILEWNAVAIQADQSSYSGLGVNDQNGPTRSSRALAIESVAMFDAWNSINNRYTPYLTMAPNAAGASDEAAVAQAGHDTIVALYPHQQATIDAALTQSLSQVPDGPAKDLGIAVGQYVAQQILQARANDGSNIPGVYIPDNQPGHHQADPLNPNQGFLGPAWGNVTPFAIPSTAAIPTPPSPALTSLEYTEAYEQVKALGAADSTVRTTDETEMGLFWGYDVARGLGDPPRLFNQIARVIAAQENNSVGDNARMFALINIAMADAGIQCWGIKYRDDFWRPIIAIRQSDPGTGPTGLGDGNPDTVGDPTWSPLGAPKTNPLPGEINFTPPFPSYTSGHATFAGAAFKVMADFYQTDDIHFSIPFTFISDELNGVSTDVQAAIPDIVMNHIRDLLPRSYESLSQAAAECAASRIFLGIHFRFDAIQGVSAGDRIGDYTFDNLLRPRLVGGSAHVPTADFTDQIDAYLSGTYTTFFSGGPGTGNFSGNEAFLNQAYLDILGRRFDDVGHAYWMGQMQQGMSREAVMQGIENSPECLRRKINQAYHDLLGRNADAVGYAAWSDVLAHGGTMTDVRAGIAASVEFNSSAGSFLAKLYQRALDRGVDPVGQNFWNGQLAAGVSQFDVAHGILSSSEFLGSEVNAFYQNFLNRTADAAGRDYWMSVLQSGRDDLVCAGIVGSQEYFNDVNPM